MGSSGEYGKLKSPHIEKYSGSPNSYYASSKLKASKFLIYFFKKEKFPVVILRLYQAYGPKQSINRLIPIVLTNSILGKSFACTEGKQYRDFIYIDDVIDAVMKCLLTKKKILGHIFNLGTGKAIKIKKIIEKIHNLTKKGNPQFGKLKMRNDEILKIFPNVNKIKNILGWKPKTSFNQGLQKTLKKRFEKYNNLKGRAVQR